ncbi:MAG: hypothetical protein QOJ54_1321 [Aliidongia sp.]|jgi:ParB/RepB/Spo0J family partition protein|nr:hypothetical protein [Aliidongia sp.]
MELIHIDPKLLSSGPVDPRRTAAPALSDQQLAVNIAKVGLLQPPLARRTEDGVKIIAGRRRVAACVSLERPLIPVLILDDDTSDDAIRALSENVQRQNLGPVDQWRAIEQCLSERWTEEAIAVAMGLTVRTIRKLRLLAGILPGILDRIAIGDMPSEQYLRTIAAATREEQAAVWKRHKPTKGRPTVSWFQVAQALQKHRISAAIAKFGPDEEQAFGIVWEDDLFEQAGQESRFTTQVDAFMAAQQAWLEVNVPKNGVILAVSDHGDPKLSPKAERIYGKPSRGDSVGYHVNLRTGVIEEIAFRLRERARKSGRAGTDPACVGHAPPPRPDITQKGRALIGDIRTEALHQAIKEAPIADDTLLGLLVLALAAANVSVHTPHGHYGTDRRAVANGLVEGGKLTGDSNRLRQAARAMLVEVLSCRENASNSGLPARLCGEAVNADAWLPNMATEEFLSCLSRSGMEKSAGIHKILPRQRVKDTRAALISDVAGGTFILPEARFALTDEEAAEMTADSAAGPADEQPKGLKEDDEDAEGESLAEPASWQYGESGQAVENRPSA